MVDKFYVEPVDINAINKELLTLEAQAAFGSWIWAVNIHEDIYLKFTFLDGSEYGQADCEALVGAHNGSLNTVQQNVKAQTDSARASAQAELFDLRDQTPTAMYAIWLGRKYRDLEGDTATITTKNEAAAYIKGKLQDIADAIYAGNTADAADSWINYEQAKFQLWVLVSEYASDGLGG